ncbi:homeodomain-like protein [Tanacetum coccineum]
MPNSISRNIYQNLIDTHVDLPQWRDSKGVLSMFSVRGAWEALRLRGTEFAWYHIVWFSYNIPRHAFNLWLVIRRSLKTQDRVRQWEVGPNVDLSMLCCKLCDAQPDSHEHLFFECPYSARIWILIRSLAGMELISPRLHDIISYLQPIAHRRNARSVIGRILVAAAAYFIWVEQNNRVFKNSRRSPEELLDSIIVTVRLKLLTFRFNNTTAVQDILARWKMPSRFDMLNGSLLYCKPQICRVVYKYSWVAVVQLLMDAVGCLTGSCMVSVVGIGWLVRGFCGERRKLCRLNDLVRVWLSL